MPELPEVEHFKKFFNHTSLHKKIDHIICKNKKLLIGGSVVTINKTLRGDSFGTAYRKGKFLIAPITKSDTKVVFHFGLTGFFIDKQLEATQKQYAKVIFVFTNGTQLQWADKRNFGRVYVVTDLNKIKTLKTMGPDALSISAKEFNALLQKKKANLKTLLMDQQAIGGIGNDYSNELLFEAGINPKMTVDKLSSAQKKKLFVLMKRILKKAIALPLSERKATFPKSWLLAHKKDMTCPKNSHHKLKRITIGGRTALYCPEHQK